MFSTISRGPVGELAAQRRAVAGELGLQRLDVGDRVAARLERGAVDHVHQHRAALDVAQELQPEPAALGRARDQPGHVGDGEDLVARLTTPRFGTSVVNG